MNHFDTNSVNSNEVTYLVDQWNEHCLLAAHSLQPRGKPRDATKYATYGLRNYKTGPLILCTLPGCVWTLQKL